MDDVPAGDAAAGPASACDACSHTIDRRDLLAGAASALVAAVAIMLGAPALAEARARPLADAAPSRRREERRYAIPESDGAFIDEQNEVILVRWAGAVYAFSLACPHQNTALRWMPGDRRFQCPKHKSRYRPDGTFIEGRATRGMDRFGIRRDGPAVVVDLDVLLHAVDAPAAWAAAYVPAGAITPR